MGKTNASELYDAVVVGGGPAGLTAALYLARARYRVLVVEKEKFGGQITITHEVVNYPGVAQTSGTELTETMRKQAESFGAEFLLAEVTGIENSHQSKVVTTTKGNFECLSILLAVGSTPRMIGFPGEKEFRGHGVAYCATCDGEFFTGKDVFVIGGGFAAAEESVFLTKYAKHVHILFRKGDFSCAPAVADAAREHEKITIHPYTVVEELWGDTFPRVLRYKNIQTGEVSEYKAPEGDTFGVFVLAGYAPATKWLQGIVDLTEGGNIFTDKKQQTSTEGIFAAGDVCVKELRQVVTATGEAASAATQMEHYIAAKQKETGLVPQQPMVARKSNSVKNNATNTYGSDSGGTSSQGHVSASPCKGENNNENQGLSSGNVTQGMFDDQMKAQLQVVFDRMAQPVLLQLSLDNRPVSAELYEYAKALDELTEKVRVEVTTDFDEVVAGGGSANQIANVSLLSSSNYPCVRVCLPDGTYTGLAFHGVPGGHEFTSFVLGLYNAAGPGQPLGDEERSAIAAIEKRVDITLLVSLSCTMCPDTVVAAQRIASLNSNVTAEVYDLNHFPDLKDKYQVMSVPCMVVNEGEAISFGKKNIQQILELLKD